MGKHNYNKDFKKENPTQEVEETVIETETPAMVETVIETETPAMVETEVKEEKNLVFGKVVGCIRLRVRKQPSLSADNVCEILQDTKVVIDNAESTDDFYKVTTETGIEGYCMKDYIKVRS